MKDILLLGKKIIIEKSPLLMDYKPDDNWQEVWQAMGGEWHHEDGWLIGSERGNKGGLLFSKKKFEGNILMTFTAATVLPATRDVNAVYCAHWNDSADYLGDSYVCGLNGWYEEKSGIERCTKEEIKVLTPLYQYTPGEDVRISAGLINGHNFLVVDDVLICELFDPFPLTDGHVGFSPYCTKMKIKDIEVREICWEKRNHSYEAEF